MFRSRGRSGELTAEIYSSRPERADELVELRQVVLERSGQRYPMELESIWFHDGRPVFKFVGVDSISAAEQWEGADVLVSAGQGVQAEEGEYTHAELIGCKLERAVDGSEIGIVQGVEEYGSAPLLVVKAEGGREVLVPFVGSFCKTIDVAGKVIRMDLPEGLLDV